MEELIYPGFMSKEASDFFGNNLIREDRDGCGAVGHFVKLENGRTVMPNKGDMFVKDEHDNIKLHE